MIPDADNIKLLGTIVGEVVYSSALHMQLKEFATDIQGNNICISSNCSLSISSCDFWREIAAVGRVFIVSA